MNQKRILICGATGFLGRNIYERFKGEYNVVGVGFKESSDVQADLTKKEDVERVTKGAYVIIQMAAACTGVKDVIERPYVHVTDNAVMNSFLLRSAFENNVGHFIFPSCTNVYPSSNEPHKETDEIKPHEKYRGGGGTKIYLENMCQFFSGLGRTRHTIIRHSNIYGPHDKYDLNTSHVFAATINKVLNTEEGGEISVWGDGSEKRDLLYSEDLVDFVELAIKERLDGIYNVGSGEAVSVSDLVQRVIKESEKNLRIKYDESQPTMKINLSLDCTKAKKELGWMPKTSLEEGIRKTIDWYKKNFSS